MTIEQIKYLHWAKTHPRARYELTVSGIQSVGDDELAGQLESPRLTIRGAYGHTELIALIADRYRVAAEQVLPVSGTSTANFIALACACGIGGVAAVESPAYGPLLSAASFLGARIERFTRDPATRFAPRLDEVRQCLDRGVRAVVLSDLHNPSGCFCPIDTIVTLARLCAERSATLIVDEVYRDCAHINGRLPLGSVATCHPNIVATNSLTKVYGFGGIRAGWIIAPPDFIERAQWALNHLCVDLPAPSTGVAINVFRRIDRYVGRTRAIYRTNRRLFSTWLATRQDLTDYGNDGATFSWLKLPGGVQADPFCEFLRHNHDTQITPGSFFDTPDHIRIAYGALDLDLPEALSRVGRALDHFKIYR